MFSWYVFNDICISMYLEKKIFMKKKHGKEYLISDVEYIFE